MKSEVQRARRSESAWRWITLGVIAVGCALGVAGGMLLVGRYVEKPPTAPTSATKFRDLEIRDGSSRAVISLPTCALGEAARVTASGSWECYSDLGDHRPKCRRNVRGDKGIIGTYLTACDEAAGDLTIVGFKPHWGCRFR